MNNPERIKLNIFLFIFLLSSLLTAMNSPETKARKIELKINKILSLLTLEEKIDMLSGYKGYYIRGIERLNIPPVRMADSTMGLSSDKETTAFPAGIAMAASWNRKLMYEVGSAIGRECKIYNVGILLGPGVNMYRVPQNGRNFEYFGEDPYLVSRMIVPFIQGVQDQKVIATVKHFVCNNQDYDRHRTSSNVDERTLREIYFPAYKAAVKEAGVLALMTAYNMLNNIHCSEHSGLLNKILKHEWGFQGIAMSDWVSVYSTKPLNAGLDLEMPKGQYLNKENIIPLIKKRTLKVATMNDKIRSILRVCM